MLRHWRIHAQFAQLRSHRRAYCAPLFPEYPGGRAWRTVHDGRSRCRAASRGRSTARRPCSGIDSRN
jgi:hypothetical protein